jgi:aspartate racemase
MDNSRIIGMIGGTGWASTAEYYRLINEKVNARMGGFQFARCLLYSMNYGEIHDFNVKGDLESIYILVLAAARRLQAAGVGCMVLCANTLHQYADRLLKEVPVPIIHIADATATEIIKDRLQKVGLLGTGQTMEMDFYKNRMAEHGIEVIIPDIEDRKYLDQTIRKEFVANIFTQEASKRILQIINVLEERGAEGIILGCTEIPLVVKQDQTRVKLYDTTEIHADAIVDFFVGPL